jgi:hypothetical protein
MPNALLEKIAINGSNICYLAMPPEERWVDVRVSAWPTTSPSSLIEFATPLFAATSSCSYFTTRVSFVAWANVVEPELNVPVTVRLYVPAGVPPVPLFPPPPPPQDDKTLAMRNKQANANPLSNRTGCLRRQAAQIPSSANPGKPAADHHTVCGALTGGNPTGVSRFAEVPPVVTTTLTDDGAEPLSVTELGEREHVERVGAPLQLRATG